MINLADSEASVEITVSKRSLDATVQAHQAYNRESILPFALRMHTSPFL